MTDNLLKAEEFPWNNISWYSECYIVILKQRCFFFFKAVHCISSISSMVSLKRISWELLQWCLMLSVSLWAKQRGLGTFKITSLLAKITDTVVSSGRRVGWMLSPFRNLTFVVCLTRSLLDFCEAEALNKKY